MTWTEAISLAKEGKDQGYYFLYEQTYRASYYIALKYMKQEDVAQDVLQDAYIKAFDHLDTLQDADKFPGWIARIVTTTALDELKKRKVVLFSQLQTEDEEISMEEILEDERTDTQPELAIDQKETKRLVQEMIDTLSDEQKFCVMMYYVEELSVKEIAQTLNVSENTVKSRLKYGRKNIEEKVRELEKKGTKLYSFAPFTFFLYLLHQDVMAVQTEQVPLNAVWKGKTSSAVGSVGKAVASKATAFTVKKAVIGITIGAAVCGGAVAVSHFVKEKDIDRQDTVVEAPIEEVQEVQPTIEPEIQEEETVNDRWQEAYMEFADELQSDGNGYALLEVTGCEEPILVVMPELFEQSFGDTSDWELWGFESEEAYAAVLNATNPMKLLTEDSCLYTEGYWLELYYYDAKADKVRQIMNAESDSPDGALIDYYMDGFYLTYLRDEKLLVGELVGSSAILETYSFHTATGNLQTADTYLDEAVNEVNRADIVYYRSVEQALEHIGASKNHQTEDTASETDWEQEPADETAQDPEPTEIPQTDSISEENAVETTTQTQSAPADGYNTLYMENDRISYYASADGLTCVEVVKETGERGSVLYTVEGIRTYYPEIGQVIYNEDGSIKIMACGCCASVATYYGITSFIESQALAESLGYQYDHSEFHPDFVNMSWVGNVSGTWPHNLCWYYYVK